MSNKENIFPLYDPIYDSVKMTLAIGFEASKLMNFCPYTLVKSISWKSLDSWNQRELFLLISTIILLLITLTRELNSLKNFFCAISKTLCPKKYPKSRLQGKLLKAHLDIPEEKFSKKIPLREWKDKFILKRLANLSEKEMAEKTSKKVSGELFTVSKSLNQLSSETSNLFLNSTLENLENHQSTRQIENEIVSMTLNLFNSHKGCSGLVTSGYSESIFLGLLAHKKHFNETSNPEIVISESAHPSFFKSCDFLGIKPKIVKLNLNKNSSHTSTKKFKNLITKNTICIVASASDPTFGLFDPIADLNTLAGKNNIGLFLDSSAPLLLPFKKQAEVEISEPITDFRLKNLTAIVCNLDRYGMSPSGCSVLMFGDSNIQKSLYYCSTQGKFYKSARLVEERSSALSVAAWANLMHFGKDGLAGNAVRIFESVSDLVEKVEKIKDLRVVGNPYLNCLVITSDNLDIFSLGNYLEENGWVLEGVVLGEFRGLHLTVTPVNAGELEKLASLLMRGSQSVKSNSEKYKEGSFAVFRALDVELDREVFENYYHEYFEIDNYLDEDDEDEKKGKKKGGKKGKKGKRRR